MGTKEIKHTICRECQSRIETPLDHKVFCSKLDDLPNGCYELEETFYVVREGMKKDKSEQKLNDQWKGGNTPIRPTYYAKYEIDPWTFIIKNQLGMDVGSVVKYVVRHQDKNGVEDLNKAIKCIEMMKEHYYNEKS
jgi:hypothetical protein|tara:strand:- start:437 stop:844 length:408 start_codon:yes stop_codon:yes gene_type:complete